MKKFYLIIFIIFLFISCKSDDTIVFEEYPLDVFLDNKKNIELSYDLISYNYHEQVSKTFRDFNETEFSLINWSTYVNTNNKVMFKISIDISNERILKKQNIIKAIIKNKVIDNTIKHKAKFDDLQKAVDFTDHSLTLLDNEQYKEFYLYGSEYFRNNISLEDFLKESEEISKAFGKPIIRTVVSKQIFDKVDNAPEGVYFRINYTVKFKGQDNISEYLIVQKSKNNKWIITGYFFNKD